MSESSASYSGRRGAEVRIANLMKSYQAGTQTIHAVDHVNLDIPSGSLVALAGPSGSGKSTLLHLIGAMDRPDSGSITVDDVDITTLRPKQLPTYRRRVGFVFQRFNLLPALNAADNVTAPVLPYKVEYDKHAKARELLATVGLAGRETALPSSLSGGQQQRVAIARSLINDPDLLLADEPTGNLDSRSSTEILDVVTALRSERGMTVIIATHDPRVAVLCDRMIQIRDGRIVNDVDLSETHDPDAVLRLWNDTLAV